MDVLGKRQPTWVRWTEVHLKDYMNLTETEAFYYCQQLFDKVQMHHGDLCLLWHNSNPAGNPWQRSIYTQLLDLIK